MEEGEGDGGPGKLSSGTGLGEGEGQKDVSERIENQVSIVCFTLIFKVAFMRNCVYWHFLGSLICAS